MWVNWNEPYTLHQQHYTMLEYGCKQSLPMYPQGQSETCYQECGCNSQCNVMWWNLIACMKGLQRFWLHRRDRNCLLTQTYNNCADAHLGGGVLSPSITLMSAIAWMPDPTIIGSMALRKTPWRFCRHCRDLPVVYWCLGTITRPCGEVVRAVLIISLSFCHFNSTVFSSAVIQWPMH